MPSPLSRQADGACSPVRLHRQRPSLCNSQVGSCNYCFGTCSAFTHVTACTLAESPCDPLHRKLRQVCYLRLRFDCYRVERTSSRAGVSPAEVQRLFHGGLLRHLPECDDLIERKASHTSTPGRLLLAGPALLQPPWPIITSTPAPCSFALIPDDGVVCQFPKTLLAHTYQSPSFLSTCYPQTQT